MKYLPTAFAQLAFVWKLYNFALSGRINRKELDTPITFSEGASVFVLPDQIFASDDDFILAFENQLTIAFGAAAITLNRSIEELKVPKPNPIETEDDQFVMLAYQIRNAFAHDIAEPKWEIRRDYARRRYEFGGIDVDLTDVHQTHFSYEAIGGPDTLFHMNDYFSQRFTPKHV